MSKRRDKSPLRVVCRSNPILKRKICKWVCRPGARIRAAEFSGRGKYNQGWTAILHPSTKERGRWQLSLFDKDGAFGDSVRSTCDEALDAREILPSQWKLKAVE